MTHIHAVRLFDTFIWHQYVYTSLTLIYCLSSCDSSQITLFCFVVVFFKKMFPLKLAKFITLQQEGIFSSPCFVCAVVCVLCCGTSCVHSTRSAAVALSHTENINSGQDKDLGTDSLT